MAINFQDPQTWVAIAFILFFLFFGKIIWKKFTGFLDSRIDLIKDQIKESQDLHNEAKELLTNEKKKVQELENQVKAIIEESKQIAQDILIKNKEKIEEEIKRLEKECEDKIYFLEQEAAKEIKDKVSQESIQMTVDRIKNNLSDQGHEAILTSSISEIEKGLHKKDIS